MPVYEVTDPDTGTVLELEGDSLPTEAELIEIFGSIEPEAAVAEEPALEAAEAPDEEDGGILGSLERIGSEALGGLETAATFVTGAGAEVAAGIGGLAKTITSGPEAGEDVVGQIREGLTFQPRTVEGKRNLEAVGGFLAPVGKGLQKVESFIGDFTADIGAKTGSPTIEAFAGAFGATLPTAALELLGLKGAGKIAKKKGLRQAAKRTAEQTKALQKAAPTVEQLKKVSRGVYKEIDDLGAKVKPDQYNRLVRDIQVDLKKSGFRPRIDEGVAKLMDEFSDLQDGVVSVADVDDLRTVAQGFAKSIDPKTKALGSRIIDSIDGFLDGDGILDVPEGAGFNVGERYKTARKFWGQARKSETLAEMVELAEANRGGFVNGIRTEFLKLVRNKKRNRFFTKEERLLIKQVADGDKATNLFKNLAKLNITRAGGGSLIPLAGPGGGLAALAITGDVSSGGVIAAVGPLLGQVSDSMAIKLTKGNARFADDVLRAGKDGKRIAGAYFEHVKKGARSTDELAELLVNPDLDVSKLPKTKFTQEALDKASKIREQSIIAAEQAAIAQRGQQEQPE